MLEKKCAKCDETKPLEHFSKQKGGRLGYKGSCKKCAAKYSREYRRTHLDSIRENHRRYDEANREKTRAWTKAWQDSNRDKVNSYAREYRQANRDLLRKKDKEYGRANRELRRNNDHRRRARIAGAGDYLVTKKDLARIMRQPCAYCGGLPEHIDHVIPIAKGGAHKIGNLVSACSSCNLRKGSKFLSVWRLRDFEKVGGGE